nr:voltage-dependent anion-selective channel protein 2-like [Misgurnus anguillicaudatus]
MPSLSPSLCPACSCKLVVEFAFAHYCIFSIVNNNIHGFGIVKLDVKTKSQIGVEFNTSGSTNTETGKAGVTLETKYKMKDLGLSLNQKWNTDSTFCTEISFEDQLAQGLKVALDTSFVPNTGTVSSHRWEKLQHWWTQTWTGL